MKQRVNVRSVSDLVKGQICYPFPPHKTYTPCLFDVLISFTYNIQNTSYLTNKKEEKQDKKMFQVDKQYIIINGIHAQEYCK